MDTSETYIKMMQANRDLMLHKYHQGFENGDYVHDGHDVVVIGTDFLNVANSFIKGAYEVRVALSSPLKAVTIDNSELPYTLGFKYATYNLHRLYNPVWLPRQDQLQEMLCWGITGRFGVMLIDELMQFAKVFYKPIPFGDDSVTWEQLWLAFVMHKKYNKTWDGENWV